MHTLEMRPTRRGMLFVIVASSLWGTTGVVSQALANLSTTSPLSVASLRMTVAAPILLLVGWRLLGRKMWSASRQDFGLMMLIGVLIAADQALYFIAISLTGVTVATLVAVCAAPVLVMVFTSVKERKAPARFSVTIVLMALIGTALLVTGDTTGTQHPASLLGVLVAVGSACGYAAIILFSRFLSGKYHALQINALGFSTGAICLLIVSRFVGFVGTYPLTGWVLILYLGTIPTAMAYGLFVLGMRSTPSQVASVLVLLEPLTAAILAWVLFGERLSLVGIVGAVLLLGTIFALSREAR